MQDDNTENNNEIDEQRERMFAFATSLLRKRDAAMEARTASGIERQWREDQDLFDGIDEATKANRSMLDYATGRATARDRGQQVRSTVVVNIVRQKTETAAGRFCDIMMPVDDKNWELKPTPVPELAGQLKDDRPAMQGGQPITDESGNPAQMRQVVADMMAKARERMEAMETEIDDQLTECQYNGECRRVIFDAARLGTGVLKGPSVVKRFSQRWASGPSGHQIEMVEEHKPDSKRVDPWNVYPDPMCGDDITQAAYMWERDLISFRTASKLFGLDGYFDDQLKLALQEPPKRTVVITDDKGGAGYRARSEQIAKGGLYELWEYHGDVDREDLEMIGCDCGVDDLPMGNVSVCVVFINDHPVKVALNLLDTGDLPYDFFRWSQVADSPWGVGVPRMLAHIQRIITAAWRATMDNSGDTAGAIRVFSRRDIEPADGNWIMTRNKIFWYTGDDDARKAFSQVQLDSRQQELQAIIELGLRFADMETGITSLFQGEGRTAPETLGATNIMVDSNNVTIRLRIKQFDDAVTVPHLTRYYHYNMMYSPKEHIKGDYQVDPRGVRVLMERDQQAQAIVALWPLLADPEIAAKVDKEKAARQLFGAHRLDILKDNEQEAAASQQQQPQQQQDTAAQAATVRAQAQLQVAQINQQADMAELELKKAMAEADRQHQERMKQVDLQIAMMKMANDRNISLESIKAALATDTMKLQTQKELSAGKTAPQVAMPPTEPVGKAPAGEAYQR